MLNHSAEERTAKHVLLVEDEDRLRGILARYLRSRGHHVIEALSAAEARRALDLDHVDVVLLDINLGTDTGWDVLRWLHRNDDHSRRASLPRVVVVSAVPPSAKRLEQFRPDAVLNKPFPVDALARLVETACEPSTVEGGWD